MDERSLNALIAQYDRRIRELWGVTAGGRLRASKGKLVEELCEEMIRMAWESLGGEPRRLAVTRKTYRVENGKGNSYRIAQDKQVYVDGDFVLSIECKAYAEVAMYKRILVDGLLLRSKFPKLRLCLFQLESMLGGDYATAPNHPKLGAVHQ